MGRRVAIVGGAPSAAKAPYTDPSWEVWALPWRNQTRGIARYFDPHSRATVDALNDGRYLAFLRSVSVPVYMAEAYPDIPASVAYPIGPVIDMIGRNYLASSVAYMLALAIAEDVDEIGIWGVAMAHHSEYAHQRPNMDWLIGLAEGRGIPVYLPPGCPLASCPERYGAI